MLQQYYSNLLAQFDKVFRHNRQGSYKTRYRYAEAFRRFLLFLAQLFHLERLPNIAPKHLYAYVDYLTERGLSAAYIKMELSAIRFYHDQIPGARYALPDNSKLDRADYIAVANSRKPTENSLATHIWIQHSSAGRKTGNRCPCTR